MTATGILRVPLVGVGSGTVARDDGVGCDNGGGRVIWRTSRLISSGF